MSRIAENTPVYIIPMATNSTLLCIHRDPSQLQLLEEYGYNLVTATNGHDGLQLFRSRYVDAIVLDFQLELLDGGVVASVIKKVRPQIPIVMLADDMELPSDSLKSVDALVAKSDGPHFLAATVHFVLSVKPARCHDEGRKAKTSARSFRANRSRGRSGWMAASSQSPTDVNESPFSRRVWQSILDGTFQF